MRWSPGCNCCGLSDIGTKCCLGSSASLWPDGVLIAPGSAVDPDYDEANCAAGYFPFGDMIVEVDGYGASSFGGGSPSGCWKSSVDGSYSVPNQRDLTIPGGGFHDTTDRGCLWQKEFALNPAGCSSPSQYHLRITVGMISPGTLRATTSIRGPFGSFGAVIDAFAVNYQISYIAPTPADLSSGPLAIPSQTSGWPDLIVSL